jgi:hypothetical protein
MRAEPWRDTSRDTPGKTQAGRDVVPRLLLRRQGVVLLSNRTRGSRLPGDHRVRRESIPVLGAQRIDQGKQGVGVIEADRTREWAGHEGLEWPIQDDVRVLEAESQHDGLGLGRCVAGEVRVRPSRFEQEALGELGI